MQSRLVPDYEGKQPAAAAVQHEQDQSRFEPRTVAQIPKRDDAIEQREPKHSSETVAGEVSLTGKQGLFLHVRNTLRA